MTRAKYSKIAIINEGFSENLGDALIHQSLNGILGSLNYSAFLIELSNRNHFDKDGNASNNSYKSYKVARSIINFLAKSRKIKMVLLMIKWMAFDLWPSIANFRRIRDCSRVIIGGGQLFTQTYGYFPPRLLLVYVFLRFYSVKYAVVGVGVGRIKSRVVRAIYYFILRDAALITVRDEVSKERLQDYFGKLEVVVLPDLVFSLDLKYAEAPDSEKREILINIQNFNEFNDGCTVSPFDSESSYDLYWIRLIGILTKSGYKIRLGNNGSRGDFDYVSRLYRRYLVPSVLKDSVLLEDRMASTSNLIESISSVEAVISTRMHAGILAYVLGKVVVPYVWDDKVRNVWNEVDEEVRVFDLGLQGSIDESYSDILEILKNSRLNLSNRKLAREKLFNDYLRILGEW